MPVAKPRARIMAERIDGLRLGPYTLKLAAVRPVGSRTGWVHMTVGIVNADGVASRGPLATGIVSGGGRGVEPWVECRLYPEIDLDGRKKVDSRATGLEAGIVDVLGELVPPGGHMMVDYESAGQEDTFNELMLRVPAPASYLGALMFRAGFRGHFKDWYFSEGGHEGPRKLQANKSPNAAEARRAMSAHRRELTAFIKRPPPGQPVHAAVIGKAQQRARMLLKEFRIRP